MPATYFSPGILCFLDAVVHNPGEALRDAPLVVMLDIGAGVYWFWPGWKRYPPDVDWTRITASHGSTVFVIVPEFAWPGELAGFRDGIIFWGALLNQAGTEIAGGIGTWSFGYGPMAGADLPPDSAVS
jgi:hypothetical protein